MKSYDNTRGLGFGQPPKSRANRLDAPDKRLVSEEWLAGTIKLQVWKGVSILAVVALLGLWAVAVRRR